MRGAFSPHLNQGVSAPHFLMKTEQVMSVIRECVEKRTFCELGLYYEFTRRHVLPVAAADDRFLAVQESDYRFDGFIIIDYRHVDIAVELPEKCSEIARLEGLFDGIRIPPVDISGYRSVFAYLANSGTNIEVEICSDFDRETAIFAGRAVGASEYEFRFLRFFTNCVWDKRPFNVGYDRLRAVKFGSRYLEIYSKYLPNCPAPPVRN